MIYTKPIEFDDKWHIVLLQCRIKPDMIRVPEDCQNQFYIINDSAYVRPTGLIMKELTKAEAQDFLNKGRFETLPGYNLQNKSAITNPLIERKRTHLFV